MPLLSNIPVVGDCVVVGSTADVRGGGEQMRQRKRTIGTRWLAVARGAEHLRWKPGDKHSSPLNHLPDTPVAR